jgi:hypothetical protein
VEGSVCMSPAWGPGKLVIGVNLEEEVGEMLDAGRTGACSIFLCVDRSINKIFKPRVLFFNRSLLQKVCIYLLLIFFMFTALLLNCSNPFKMHIPSKLAFFRKSALLQKR